MQCNKLAQLFKVGPVESFGAVASVNKCISNFHLLVNTVLTCVSVLPFDAAIALPIVAEAQVPYGFFLLHVVRFG